MAKPPQPTLVEKFRKKAENHRVLAALILASGLLGGAEALTGSVSKLLIFLSELRRPALDFGVGPGLELNYAATLRELTLRFPVTIGSGRRHGDQLQSLTLTLDSVPARRPIHLSGGEIRCMQQQDLRPLPWVLSNAETLRMDCTAKQQLGSQSEEAFLTSGFFELTVLATSREGSGTSGDLCYFMTQSTIADFRFGASRPRVFDGSCKLLRKAMESR